MARTIDPIIEPTIASEVARITRSMNESMLGAFPTARTRTVRLSGFSGGINSTVDNSLITELTKRRTQRPFKVGDVVRIVQNLHEHCGRVHDKVSKIIRIAGISGDIHLDPETACNCYFTADELRLEKNYIDPRIGIIKK